MIDRIIMKRVDAGRAMGEKRITVSDVAKAAKVSKGLAAAVLSNRLNNTIRVSEAKAAHIREVARRLDFVPNPTAKMLAGGASRIVGVVIDSSTNPSQFQTLALLEALFGEVGYRIMISEVHDSMEEVRKSVDTLQRYGADAIIVMSHEYPEFSEELARFFRTCPRTILIGNSPDATLPAVRHEYAAGLRQGLDALSAQGARRVAMIALDLAYPAVCEQVTAFAERVGDPAALARISHSRDPQTLLARIGALVDGFLLPGRFEAVFMPNDKYALALFRELAARGLRVPDDMIVMGYENEVFCDLLRPSLSSIDENNTEVARQTVALVLDAISGAARDDWVVTVPTRLVPRESSLILQHRVLE